MLSAQMKLAQERGQLISKRLVEAQSSWLLIAVRQKLLNLPQTYARRLLGINDAKVMQAAFKEMASRGSTRCAILSVHLS
jgi:hypothetical protein